MLNRLGFIRRVIYVGLGLTLCGGLVTSSGLVGYGLYSGILYKDNDALVMKFPTWAVVVEYTPFPECGLWMRCPSPTPRRLRNIHYYLVMRHYTFTPTSMSAKVFFGFQIP